VGGTQTLQANVRVIAASNRDVEAEVAAGRFRQDLFWRLDVIRLALPPLRDRAGDVPLLAQHFVVRMAAKDRKTIRGFTPEAIDALAAYRWPGNVRELENAVERAVVLCRDEWIDVQHLPAAVRQGEGRRRLTFEVGTPLKAVERALIEETLRYTGGDKGLAASLLGITARTIYRREAEWAAEARGERLPADDE
jgi:two-component system response regulator HydG